MHFKFLPAAIRQLVLCAAMGIGCAQAADTAGVPWPTQPVRLVVGFPPGSVQDLSARAIAIPLARELGQMVLVENRSGASGTIAADKVARAQDLHTFGVMNNSQLTIARLLNPAVPYDPASDLAPLGLIGTTPLVLVVSSTATGDSPADLLAWLRSRGQSVFYGSPGNGTPGHLGMELLKGVSGFEAEHVPYPGNPQIITALIGGQVQAALLPPGLAMQHVKSGKLRAIGVTSLQRSPLAPELPPLAELGVRGAELELWSALAGPASLPPAIREKLATVLMRVVQGDEARRSLLGAGWQATPSTAEGLRARMRSDTEVFGAIVRTRAIRAEN